jgi:hypothetical protein
VWCFNTGAGDTTCWGSRNMSWRGRQLSINNLEPPPQRPLFAFKLGIGVLCALFLSSAPSSLVPPPDHHQHHVLQYQPPTTNHRHRNRTGMASDVKPEVKPEEVKPEPTFSSLPPVPLSVNDAVAQIRARGGVGLVQSQGLLASQSQAGQPGATCLCHLKHGSARNWTAGKYRPLHASWKHCTYHKRCHYADEDVGLDPITWTDIKSLSCDQGVLAKKGVYRRGEEKKVQQAVHRGC